MGNLDFMDPQIIVKKDVIEIRPNFILGENNDLMIKGGKFYAIWDEENNIWSMKESRATKLIDEELRRFTKEAYPKGIGVDTKYLRNTSNGSADAWKKYVEKLSPDYFQPLNNKVIFKSQVAKKEDYCNLKAEYDLEEGEPEAYNELFSVIYPEEEIAKLEWAIGSVLAGDSKKIQKFIVLYGEPGSGKGTYIDMVIRPLFKGYSTDFDAKSLASGSDQFSMEPFKDNPLVAIQSEGDLSDIKDNTKLNAIVSHENMVINEKRKNRYTMKLNSFLFMATNYPIEINSSNSGINRRLIVVQPTGKKVHADRYDILVDKLQFELGKIANKCLKRYKSMGKNYYNKYVPEKMKTLTDNFYNFIQEDYYLNFKDLEYVKVSDVWNRYKIYCNDNLIKNPMSYTKFRTELFLYFDKFIGDTNIDGVRVRNALTGFKKEKIGIMEENNEQNYISDNGYSWLELNNSSSIIDSILSNCPAQYASKEGTPRKGWDYIHTVLSDIDTSKLHYILPPENHIVIDFDLKDENGEKSKELNLEAAKKFPKTYAEYSKGGNGLHLHYIYDGNVDELENLYSKDIEIKTFKGRAALRRKLSFCNNEEVAHINTGLPMKGADKKVINYEGFKSEKALRKFISDCLDKKHHGATKPEVDFIYNKLEECYNSGMHYDVSDLYNKILAFGMSSSNQADKCITLISKMKFKSEDISNGVDIDGAPIIFLDIEVLPNLLLICYATDDSDDVIRIYNPKPEAVEALFKYRIIGFNIRRYDNHIMYARSMGYSEYQCYKLSKRIISGGKGDRDAFIAEAYNISFADIYDFTTDKKSLKKWEIELDIPHKEFDWDWDQPLPEEYWKILGDYCANDVLATKKVFHNKDVQADFKARQILADISGLSINDTTNMHTTKIIVGNDKNPQSKYVYTNLATGERTDGTKDKVSFPGYRFNEFGKFDKSEYAEDAKIVKAKSIYKGFDPSEGGFALGFPGVYPDVALLDVKSMHPSSIENLNYFGPYTDRFSDLKKARIAIKEGRFEDCKDMFDGKLMKYLDNPEAADELAYALKIAINSVYGLTSATFDNKLKDPRNKDNIVAKRGALFMIDLMLSVTAMGYKVVHIKTDSIKIANADTKIIDYVMDFGKRYGYEFDHEATYERMCILNDAVYIAKYANPDWCEGVYGYIPKDCKKHADQPWTATGKEFQVPYVFKSLFSGEDILPIDYSVVNSVSTSMYLDMNNGEVDDPNRYIFIGKVGNFVPVIKDIGGTLLCKRVDKEGNVKYDSVQGTKNYYFLEYDTVKELNAFDKIDEVYFANLLADAKNDISQYYPFEKFITEETLPIMYEPVDEGVELPFD